jgi:hypothetical protein
MNDLKYQTFKIWNDTGKGRDTHIELDGEDVSAAFNDVTVRAGVRGRVEVILSTVAAEIPKQPFEAEPARLFLAPVTRELLIKHGWTPPAGTA